MAPVPRACQPIPAHQHENQCQPTLTHLSLSQASSKSYVPAKAMILGFLSITTISLARLHGAEVSALGAHSSYGRRLGLCIQDRRLDQVRCRSIRFMVNAHELSCMTQASLRMSSCTRCCCTHSEPCRYTLVTRSHDVLLLMQNMDSWS